MQKRGFTLIEMMVAVGLFVVVALISTSALIAMSAALRRSQATKTLAEAMSVAMDSMTLRMVTKSSLSDFVCNPSCTGGVNNISFTYITSGNTYTYTYTYESASKKIVFRRELLGGGVITSDLTPPGVDVNALKFYVSNTNALRQLDQATIVMSASSKTVTPGGSPAITMQSTITAP